MLSLCVWVALSLLLDGLAGVGGGDDSLHVGPGDAVLEVVGLGPFGLGGVVPFDHVGPEGVWVTDSLATRRADVREDAMGLAVVLVCLKV